MGVFDRFLRAGEGCGLACSLGPGESGDGLDDLGLSETLRGALASWSQRYPNVRWELTLSGDLDSFGEAVNITVYRVVQEALTNVVRHAGATRAPTPDSLTSASTSVSG